MPTPEERFPATDRKILRRLDESAMRQVSLGILATVASFVAIVWIGDLWQLWPRATVVFGGLVLGSCLLQGILITGFDQLYPRGPQRWRHAFAATLLLRAAVWSAFMVALLEVPDGGALFFLAMFLPLGLAAALAATWLADIWTVRFYLVISVLPPFLRLLMEGSAYAGVLALMLGVFLYALVRMADGHYRLFWRAIAREPAATSVVPVVGAVHAKLLSRTADELRRPVSAVADTLAVGLEGDATTTAQALARARRAAQQLVDRLEAMDAGAAFLRGERAPQPVAANFRRRCEEACDDIGIVAADAGVLCTTVYDPALPERLRTDYDLLFRGLRALGGWMLEQLPPGSELVLRFRLAPGQHDDYVECAADLDAVHVPDTVRNGIERCGQGNAMLDPEVPLPLAIVCEVAGLLDGRVALVERDGVVALALSFRLELTERAEADYGHRARLKGRRLLLAGGTPALLEAIGAELAAMDAGITHCLVDELAARLREPDGEWLAVLCDARDTAALAGQLALVREGKLLRGARLLLLAPGAEPPQLPADLQRLVSGWLRLPLGRRRLRAALEEAVGIDDSRGGRPAEKPAGPLRVLLVDDNEVNRLVAQGMLEKLGCETDTAADGAAAVARVARGGIDLVLMDCEMPGMDGAEATRRIREAESARNERRLPIVAMTAHTAESEVATFLAAGMDEFIAKPVSLATLSSYVERYRQRR